MPPTQNDLAELIWRGHSWRNGVGHFGRCAQEAAALLTRGLYRAEWLLAQDRGQPCGGREHPIRGAPRRPFANWVLSPQISERKRVCYAQRVRIETDCGGCSTHLITSAAPGGIWCVIDLCYCRCEIKRTHAGCAHIAEEDTAELAQTVLANSIHFSVLLSKRLHLCDAARWDCPGWS